MHLLKLLYELYGKRGRGLGIGKSNGYGNGELFEAIENNDVFSSQRNACHPS
jgi:hypothetical protein